MQESVSGAGSAYGCDVSLIRTAGKQPGRGKFRPVVRGRVDAKPSAAVNVGSVMSFVRSGAVSQYTLL